MSFFVKQVLFSEVNGVVLNQGKPLAGVEVTRKYTDEDSHEETVKTNKDGRFHFPKATNTLFFELSFLPSEVVVTQEIFIKYQDTVYDAWLFVKDNYDTAGEIGKEPITLICDIDNEAKRKKTKTGEFVYGICQIE
ncbi:MAG: DUF4198 domain-containing protein [Methylococcaceae bacterium]|nr:DUF4198 domain-containing protein [Methylococcaceae bacterium]